jgi:2-dehydro-3-deoxyphosphogluconate aldolase / (4S)-4-hydroxy-2-oxoglutarate aldolase
MTETKDETAAGTNVIEELGRVGIMPVIVIRDPESAVPLARAFAAGGLPCLEITFRTAEAAEAIRRVADEVPDVLLGAGTILTPTQAAHAKEAGARFVVTPGFNPAVVDRCLELGLTIFPGVCTPTDIEAALGKGFQEVQLFAQRLRQRSD